MPSLRCVLMALDVVEGDVVKKEGLFECSDDFQAEVGITLEADGGIDVGVLQPRGKSRNQGFRVAMNADCLR